MTPSYEDYISGDALRDERDDMEDMHVYKRDRWQWTAIHYD